MYVNGNPFCLKIYRIPGLKLNNLSIYQNKKNIWIYKKKINANHFYVYHAQHLFLVWNISLKIYKRVFPDDLYFLNFKCLNYNRPDIIMMEFEQAIKAIEFLTNAHKLSFIYK